MSLPCAGQVLTAALHRAFDPAYDRLVPAGGSALSTVDGLARALAMRGEHDRYVVTVVTEATLAAGLSWEALRAIGAGGRAVVIVLDAGTDGAPRRPLIEALGLSYLGPVDVDDSAALDRALRKARANARPTVVHRRRQPPVRHAPEPSTHAPEWSTHAPELSTPAWELSAPAGWEAPLAEELSALGRRRDDLTCVAASDSGPGQHFARRHPRRFTRVDGGARHTVACVAGLARGGMHPVLLAPAAHAARSAQALTDLVDHRLPATVAVGPTEVGERDLAALHTVPGLRVAAPRDGVRLRALLGEAVSVHDGPTVLRYPAGPLPPDLPAVGSVEGIDILHRTARTDVLLVALGARAQDAVRAAHTVAAGGAGVTVCDPRWIGPPDPLLVQLAAEHRLVVCVEEHVRVGGTGARLAQQVMDAGLCLPVHVLGPPLDCAAGDRADLLRRHRLDATGIARSVTALLGQIG